MATRQIAFPIHQSLLAQNSKQALVASLEADLDFHSEESSYASHNFHSFPAKFPPQLPRQFIAALTNPGEVVLDPMMGSGTTVLEALLAGRRGVGFDIDPLAVMISQAKVTPLDAGRVASAQAFILKNARKRASQERRALEQCLLIQWDGKTKEFLDYWFDRETQVELYALLTEIQQVADPDLRRFFKLAFSAIIITKSGGVSLALDLGHTRPHRAKVIVSEGDAKRETQAEAGMRYHTKILRSPFEEFDKRARKNMEGIMAYAPMSFRAAIHYGNAQNLPLEDASIDLIVTSPPYASNAIDYMRAHKFSLVWLGNSIAALSQKRKEYIGSEDLARRSLESLPEITRGVVAEIAKLDEQKGKVLHRYYSEMTAVIREMHRILKPGKSAVVVVGSSLMRGRDTEIQTCLADIGRAIGFETPKIGVRNLDRDRRMMPTGSKPDLNSQIQQRMHQEFVIGFYKPE
ncbi:MAG: site-specific DNA-methyltransferase [Chloroflexi bacterium]|nr:site-specific DNA-methyltransferase [Chloroflexota bacterium]